jgi:hypothetical protein
MTQFQRLARGAALAVAAACVFAGALGGWSSPGEARKSKSQAAAQPAAGAQPAGPQKGGQGGEGDGDDKAQAQVAGRQAYDTGLKEFANGHLQQAVDQFTTALNSGGLLAPQMAKALYTRGLAYKKLNRPGLAIADLTNALWLKNGLSGDDRDKATSERAGAYQAAGIADTGNLPPVRTAVADTGATVNDSSAGLSAAAIAQAATPNSNSGSGSGSGGDAVTRQDTASEAAQDAARARAAYASSSSDNGLQSAASATVVGGGATAPGTQASAGSFGWSSPAEAAGGNSATVSSPGAAPSLTEAAPAAPAPTSSTSTLTGVFGSLFGGGSSAPASAPPPSSASVMTASTTPVEPATSSWSESTTTQTHVSTGSVASSATEKALKKSKRPEQVALATPAKPVSAPKGKYKVHIAALRSRAEAEALAQQIVTQHGADLQNHTPTVDEAVIGSMGTFYRVRIPGYASQDEPRGLCNKLRSSGLDCLVVTN